MEKPRNSNVHQNASARPDYAVTAAARLATRLSFFVAGFSMACCAPLFPFFKESVGADKAEFGLLLLCLGLGSIVAMPISGVMAARRGARPMILLGGFGLVALLPMLTLAETPLALGVALAFFGASLGTIDVAMNVHGAAVEAKENRPLMSGFHAQFSIGGVVGAGLMTLLLSFSVPILLCTIVGAAIALVSMLFARTRFLQSVGEVTESFVLPRGIVTYLALIAAICFLIEGAVLDWGALLIIDLELTAAKSAGIGYILFSIAMVVARLTGDHVVSKLGEICVLIAGSLLAIVGLGIVLVSANLYIAALGFVFVGLGAANLVPIIFSMTARQNVMPAGLAIASVTTMGYAGILVGPALIGFVADATSLPDAFWLLAVLMAIIPLTAWSLPRRS
jgi:predicted MFS family arabinose efflux permease